LLKNRRGEIDINLPISGSLDDPEFSVGGLVVKVIVNLFVKAVTSPFALLGSLFGGGEELSFLTFPEGRHTLDAAAQQRLEALARALQDRPALKLEIDGHADPERDREGLKLALLDARVRTLKRDDLVKKGVEAGSADDIAVEPAEYPGLLARVYRAEKFPKPRNLVGFVKDLPVAEMEKLIVTHTQVDEEALRALATRRAQAARDWLVTRGGVPAERIFLRPVTLETRTGAGNGGEAGENRSPSRVDFSLK
jgi:outer membrane protein OmpA-like peptidoglycan-associated protein